LAVSFLVLPWQIVSNQCFSSFADLVCGLSSPLPPWVLKELSTLIFNFFWSSKRELVSRSFIIQPSLLGGFPVVDFKLKVWSLLSQWVRRFASSPSGWVSFMSFWFRPCFDASPSGSSLVLFRFLRVSCHLSIGHCLRAGVLTVLFLYLVTLWFLVLSPLTFLFLYLVCPPSPVICTCYLRMLSSRTVL